MESVRKETHEERCIRLLDRRAVVAKDLKKLEEEKEEINNEVQAFMAVKGYDEKGGIIGRWKTQMIRPADKSVLDTVKLVTAGVTVDQIKAGTVTIPSTPYLRVDPVKE